ncbi:MAG: metal ABC transporter permease [Parachlamydiales bacterium]
MLDYLTDPLLRGPTLGSVLMAIGAALVGALTYVRGRSLLGETLSHAAYPGVVGAVALGLTGFGYLIGGFACALLGLLLMRGLERRKVATDAALTFVLALFFGIGVTLASRVQFLAPSAYRQALSLLYGQAATMTDLHLLLYGGLTLLIIATLLLFYRPLKLAAFDPHFARSCGISLRFSDTLLFTLIALSVVMGIRSVGVVLISAMLVAPAVAARPLVRTLSALLIVSAVVGGASAFIGVVLSTHWALPTGPLIVLTGSTLALTSLALAPRKGLLPAALRRLRFSLQIGEEHLLKALWKGERVSPSRQLKRLQREGWVDWKGGEAELTRDGRQRAERIVRLHRLWEVYLVDTLGIGPERVHRSAEEMEHILTPELERRLDTLLEHPQEDPHSSPIPRGRSI